MNIIPNLITSVRITVTLGILWLTVCGDERVEKFFLPLLFAGGLSDVLDGVVARRMKWCTEFGAKLDSIADLMFYSSIAVFLFTFTHTAMLRCLPFIVAGTVVQIAHIGVSLIRHGQYPAYHTRLARMFAYWLFFGVLAYWLLKSAAILPILAMGWTICSLEGLIISFLLTGPATNVSSIRRVIVMERLKSTK